MTITVPDDLVRGELNYSHPRVWKEAQAVHSHGYYDRSRNCFDMIACRVEKGIKTTVKKDTCSS